MHRWLVLGFVLFGAGCGGSSPPLPIHVGHVATSSGHNKASGDREVRAIRLAVQEQNKAAAENKARPILVRHTDTKGDLDAFEAEAVRLVTLSRAVALLGGDSADEVARLDKAQAPIVTFGPKTRGPSELVFFTGLSPTFQGQVLARFAAESLQATKLVILADDSQEDALALAEAFTRELGQAAAPRPCARRAPTSIPSLPARPPTSEASANSDVPATRIRRRPSRSAARPPSSMKPPYVSR
jgi:ABC-type branched-subunit amino acid transport system substrate-binding protein